MAIRRIPASNPKDKIQRLPDTTWFGTCAIHIATALRERVLQAFLQRRGREIRSASGGCNDQGGNHCAVSDDCARFWGSLTGCRRAGYWCTTKRLV